MDYDMWQTCRTCLSTCDMNGLVPLERNCDVDEKLGTRVDSSRTNGEILMECVNIQFNKDDGLPVNICEECATALRAAFSYKRMCEQSDIELRRIFQLRLNSAQVKIERIDASCGRETDYAQEGLGFDATKIETFDECSQSPSESSDHGTTGTTMDTAASDDTFAQKTARESFKARAKRKKKLSKKSNSDDGEQENVTRENGRLKCDICNISFLNGRTLKNHLGRQSHLNRYNQLHGAAEVIKCSRKPVEKVKKKIRLQAGDDDDVKIAERAQCVDGRFICEFCGNSFAERISLKFHIRIHLGINLKQCPFCERGFSRQGHLQQHIKINHSKNSPCQKCDQVFDSREELRLHTIEAHKEHKPEKVFPCDICFRVFNRSNNLKEHRLTHTGEKNFSCDICKGKYVTKRGLKDHMRTHGDRANYYQHLCSHCGKKFATASHMAKHVRNKHTMDEPYKCEYCGKAFRQNEALKIHILKHLDRFICKICGKSLSTKFRLISHTRIHTGEKPHKCSLCTEAFSQAKALKQHLRGHGEAVPYRCNVCDDVFTHPRWLQIHRRQFDHNPPMST